MCAAKFSLDDQWYRAKVEKVTPNDVSVLYVDYGNRAVISKTKVGSLPSTFTGLQPFATEYFIALAKLAEDVSLYKLTFHFPQSFYFFSEKAPWQKLSLFVCSKRTRKMPYLTNFFARLSGFSRMRRKMTRSASPTTRRW